MWKTSFIQFFKIIRQNKFFTFLNLFGVSITIMIILIAAIKIESAIWPGGPEKNNENMLFIKNILITSDKNSRFGGVSLPIIEDHLIKMQTPKAIAFSCENPWSYISDHGVEEFNVKSVNAGWWQVFDFEFIEGRPFNQQEVIDASWVAVIDARIKNRFFQDQNAVGQMLEISGKMYKVIGVIKNVPSNCERSFANIFVPYTLTEAYNRDIRQTGEFGVTFLSSGKNLKEIKAETENLRLRIIPLLQEGYTLYFGGPYGPVSTYLQGWVSPTEYAGDRHEIMSILGKLFLLMLLPALNLISIQLIRIHERSEEIGVRKAFGASRGELIKQILYENTLLTILGAIIGLLFTLIIVYVFKNVLAEMLFSGIFENNENIQFHINFGIFFIGLFTSLVLSLMSGIIPAIKMSRLQAVEVLKGGEL
ncbi:MAG: hypothetical protein CVU00_09365 [Bacteroidetes bacterium HGW-Bacteroidetes-17]|jgi:putative ABC transport system permease protein|nr:MAG: hypothetical protein CVU00_09365 [Bacteroidetes bacterium HGW-Bacteroidetes-17]